ncbi:MAG: trigger factor [Dorea sp.]|nr:trigger factor [Dorea sp.]
MKKRICACVLGLVMTASLLTGCQPSLGVTNEYVSIPQYEKVTVDKIADIKEVTDADVEQEINATLQAAKTTENITDRPAEQFDTVNIDFVGTMDGKEFDGGSAKDFTLELGSNSFIEGFEDSIIGHKIGDTYEWECTFPEDYRSADLAGKPATFMIKLNSITVFHVPELNDEFVQSVSEKAKNVEDYKNEVHKKLEAVAADNHTKELGQKVWDKIVENSEILSYPEDRVAERENALMEQYEGIAADQNTTVEEVAKKLGYKDLDAFQKAITDSVQKYFSSILLAEAIAEKEHIKITDQVLEEELQKIVDDYGEYYGYSTVEEMKESEDAEALQSVVLKNKVTEWLGEHCIQQAK